MNYPFKVIVILVILLGCISCTTTDQKGYAIEIIDLETGLKNNHTMLLSEIADSIVYIKLATHADYLIGKGTPLVRGNRIFIKDISSDRIIIFNRSGEYLSKIERKGKGPGEYIGISQFTVSPLGDLIAIDSYGNEELYLYNASGEFINKVTATADWNSGMFFDSENELIICTNQTLNQLPDYPVVMQYSNDLSIRDTLITRQWIELNNQPSVFPFIPFLFYRFNGKYFYKEQACDTLYQLSSDKSFQPRYVFNSGSHAMTAEALFSNNTEDFYRLMQFSETLDYFTFLIGFRKKNTLMYYDKSSKELFSIPDIVMDYKSSRQIPELKNDLDGFDHPFLKHDNDANSWISMHQMVDLKEMEQEGFFENPQLKNSTSGSTIATMVKKSSEEDNPIIRILYLK